MALKRPTRARTGKLLQDFRGPDLPDPPDLQRLTSERGLNLAQKMQVGPCIPVITQLERAEVGPTSGPTWRLSHLTSGSAAVVASGKERQSRLVHLTGPGVGQQPTVVERERRQVGPEDASWPIRSCVNTAIKGWSWPNFWAN